MWAASLIVFVLMLVVAGVAAFFGYLKVKRIKGPQKTIASLKESQSMLKTEATPAALKQPADAPSTVARR